MSQYTFNDSAKSSNSGNAFDVWNSDTVTNDRSQLLAWLSSLNPGFRHSEIQERRCNDVGKWLFETEEFRRWYAGGEEGEGGSNVLFCHGDPGVGKTFICSLVVDRLCDQTSGQNTPVSCFYLEFAERKEQSATNVLGSLLKQMVGGMERIPEEISRAFQQQKTTIGGRRPQLGNIVKMLQLITSSRRTFLCIDAIDECSGAQRVRLLDSLKQILEKSPSTRIFVTGRSLIRAEVENRLAGHVKSVSVSPARNDITRYLRIKLQEDETPDAMDEGLEAEILERIPEDVSEMFRLVSLNIEAILRESTIYRREERLRKVNDGSKWGDAYGPTIERIRAQDGDKSRLGMAALMWVSHAERPLRVDELCHALAVELGSKDFNARNAPSISTLLGCSQGLITVDEEASTVRLIHPTVKEYLSAIPDIFSRPHSAMAEICLTYLNSNQVRALSINPSAVTHDKPFLGYCSLYWGVHAKRELSDCARSLALELFLEYDGHISRKFLLEQVGHLDRWDFGGHFGSDLGLNKSYGLGYISRFSGLHCASLFGIVEVVTTLIEMECYDINEGDIRGCTPLGWAAHNGHEEVVKILLRRENICPDKLANSGRTPLMYAAWGGHEGVVETLLGRREVNPNGLDNFGRTPLLHAASAGREEVVKILLGRQEVNPSMADKGGLTPLTHAACNGHEGVLKIHLGREEVNPNQPDKRGQIPFAFAAGRGHEGIVKILLGREDAIPDVLDMSGRTPLWYASLNGHEGVVRILLGRKEVNPDMPDDAGLTPLSRAAWLGNERIVKILLGREEVNPNMPDKDGQTPLFYATRAGNEGVVKILLEREDVNPDTPNIHGQTPLWNAALDGHEGIVRILLGRREVNFNKLDNYGKTPLMAAAMWGHQGVVALLQSREARTRT